MKTYLKSTLLLFALLFIFQITGITVKAETVVNYDADAAISYAKEHWDDSATTIGNLDCTQFVRECLEAGGVPKDASRVYLDSGKPYGYTEWDYITYLVQNGYASIEHLTEEKQKWETPQWYVRASDNASVFTLGDAIFYYCTVCGEYFHASLFTGVSEDGFAEYHAQRKAVNGDELCAIDCSDCDASREYVELYSLHITSAENGYDSSYNNAVISGLTAALNEDGNVRISWNALDGATGYKVFKKNGKNSAYNYIGESTGTYLDYSSSDLKEGNAYYFAVRPYRVKSGKTYVGKLSDMFTYKYIIEVNGKLAAPVLQGAIDPSTGKPQLTWDMVSGATGYEVYRARSVDGTYFKIATVNGLSCGNSSTDPGVTYYYKIIAISSNESTQPSDYSNIVSVTCAIENPTIQVVNLASTGKLKVTWEAVAGANKYEVWRATSETGTYKKMITTSKTYYSNTSTVAGNSYYYKVKAIVTADPAANSAFSEVVKGVCALPRPTLTMSNEPVTGKTTISWDAVEGADQYEVWCATSKSGTYTMIATTAETSCIHTDAIAGKLYYYKVKAIDADNAAANSAFSTAKNRVCDLPKPVLVMANDAVTGKPMISWEALAGADSYEVWCAASETGTYTKMIATAETSYIHTAAAQGTTYYYKVQAIDADKSTANSAFSEIVNGSCTLKSPTITTTNVTSSGKPKVKWEAVAGAEKYEVWRAFSKTGEYKRMITTTKLYYTHTGAVAGTCYYYKVKAIDVDNAAANSAFSEIKSRVCDLPRPALTATYTSSGKPRITWEAIEGADKYEVWRATSETGTYKKMMTTTKNSYSNTSAVAGTTYYYKVKAIDADKSSANSAYSKVVSIKSK